MVHDICQLARNFVSVSWSFVRREGNYVAHHLAKVSVEVPEKVWWRSCPPEISPRPTLS